MTTKFAKPREASQLTHVADMPPLEVVTERIPPREHVEFTPPAQVEAPPEVREGRSRMWAWALAGVMGLLLVVAGIFAFTQSAPTGESDLNVVPPVASDVGEPVSESVYSGMLEGPARPYIPYLSIPAIPSIADVSIARIPSISPMPATSIPSIPSISVPSIPDMSIPSISAISIPDMSIPATPATPSISFPSIPDMSIPLIPDMSIPSIQPIAFPSFPSIPPISVPSIPPFPDM